MKRIALLVSLAVLAAPLEASAHCDTTDGPVVADARVALQRGDVALVLKWVRAADEPELRELFRHTVAVRRLGPEARELADRFFFETLVRVHRAGEGAPYTGLRSGAPEPIIAAADRALERGDAGALEAMLVEQVKHGLARRFAAAREARAFKPTDVAAGRTFVAAYVTLTHWVEGVHAATTAGASHEQEHAH